MTVQGDGQIIRNPGSGSSGLRTSIFQVVEGSEAINTGSTETVITWDAGFIKDNLGLDPYMIDARKTFILPPAEDGTYLATGFGYADGSWVNGGELEFFISQLRAGPTFPNGVQDQHQSTLVTDETTGGGDGNPKINVSDVFDWYAGWAVDVEWRTNLMPDAATTRFAKVTFTKLASLSPLP